MQPLTVLAVLALHWSTSCHVRSESVSKSSIGANNDIPSPPIDELNSTQPSPVHAAVWTLRRHRALRRSLYAASPVEDALARFKVLPAAGAVAAAAPPLDLPNITKVGQRSCAPCLPRAGTSFINSSVPFTSRWPAASPRVRRRTEQPWRRVCCRSRCGTTWPLAMRITSCASCEQNTTTTASCFAS